MAFLSCIHLVLTVHTVNCVQTLKALGDADVARALQSYLHDARFVARVGWLVMANARSRKRLEAACGTTHVSGSTSATRILRLLACGHLVLRVVI
jgi:hypothetical protein